MSQKLLALICILALLASPAAGFDTFWHMTASRKVGAEFGFSEDATNIMQMGNFSPDFFGPVAEFAAANLDNSPLAGLNQEGMQEKEVKAFAIFLHFDNLGGELNRNSQFDFIFSQLLKSTQSMLADFHTRKDLDDRTRKVLVLMTLGASLHAVQDFYSHSDWIHNDFGKLGLAMAHLTSGELRAPTWFEVRDKLGDPDKWPVQVHTGIYPPANDAPNTHTHMNHDNSRLIYRQYEDSGQPLLSQAKYHDAGPAPAREQDAAAILAHQQLAVDTAIAASIEWVKKVEEKDGAKAAIESAETWDLKADNKKLYDELQAGMAAQMALSCAAGKWDGEDPPPDRAAFCKSVLENKANPIPGGSAGSDIEQKVLGIAAKLGLPWALKFTGKFWSVHSKYNILGQLAQGIGTDSGHYKLPGK